MDLVIQINLFSYRVILLLLSFIISLQHDNIVSFLRADLVSYFCKTLTFDEFFKRIKDVNSAEFRTFVSFNRFTELSKNFFILLTLYLLFFMIVYNDIILSVK